MKKAKIVLSAVALFAVVGGALAFKAKSFSPSVGLYTSYTTAVGGPTYCSLAPQVTTTDEGGAIATVYRNTTLNNACTLSFTTRTIAVDE